MTDRDHDEFREWPGAYALGALEPAERRAFEVHLEGCSTCSDEVRSLLRVHGLLSQLDRAAIDDRPDRRRADIVAARARTEQVSEQVELRSSRRRWRIAAASSAAAALLIAGAGVVAVTGTNGMGEESDPPSWAEGPIVPAAITSTQADTTWISTSARGWGTEIHVDLLGLPQRSQYQLWVVDADGVWTQSSTWGPTPSGGADITGATSVAADALDRIVVTSDDRDEILIDASV